MACLDGQVAVVAEEDCVTEPGERLAGPLPSSYRGYTIRVFAPTAYTSAESLADQRNALASSRSGRRAADHSIGRQQFVPGEVLDFAALQVVLQMRKVAPDQGAA